MWNVMNKLNYKQNRDRLREQGDSHWGQGVGVECGEIEQTRKKKREITHGHKQQSDYCQGKRGEGGSTVMDGARLGVANTVYRGCAVELCT